MRKSILLLGAAAVLRPAANRPTSRCRQCRRECRSREATPTYCFFKDAETKDWAAKADKDGNVVVSGKAYREDARYKALLSPATVSGTSAEISPTITANDTGFAAPDNWWDVTQTIPNSQAVTSVKVTCGGKTVATLEVPRKK